MELLYLQVAFISIYYIVSLVKVMIDTIGVTTYHGLRIYFLVRKEQERQKKKQSPK